MAASTRATGRQGEAPRDTTRPSPQGGLGHDRPDLPLHADQLRRQGRGRSGRQADHGGAQSHARAVRLPRIVVLLPVRHHRHRRRLPRQPGADAAHAARHGDRLVARAVSHAGHGEPGNADRLPHRVGRRRRPGRPGGHARALQMVPRRAARHPDGDRRPGLRARRDRGGAAAELHHRQPIPGTGRSARSVSSDCCGPCFGCFSAARARWSTSRS